VYGELECDAARIVTTVIGRAVREARSIRDGVMTFKVRVETEDQESFIVRFYPHGREAVLGCEPDLLARCRDAGLPVPSVVADRREGPHAALAYIVYRMIKGVPLREALPGLSATQQRALAEQLARCLFELPRIGFEKFGELVSANEGDTLSWRRFVERSFGGGLDALARHHILTARDAAFLAQAVHRASHLDRCRAGQLIWGDISFWNILVSPLGALVGLIDFESCLSGDPLATLGYCFAAHGNEPLCATILDAWPEHLGGDIRDMVLLYALLRGVRLAPYLDAPLPTGHPRDPLARVFPGFDLALRGLTQRESRT
jgi:aminoglycoside phosphotransferase (APT) family kinase protein